MRIDGSITLRPVASEDDSLLYQIYASTRFDELAPIGWSTEQQEAFLRMQFNAQHQCYHQQFADADYDIILRDSAPAGRLYVNRRTDEIRIVDISLLPEYRNLGIGSSLLIDLIAEAHAAEKPLRIHVEQFNPALRLYQRLGFVKIADDPVYFEMELIRSVD